MSAEAHRREAAVAVRVAVLTVSDTRTEANDESGALIKRRLSEAGHTLAGYDIVPDDPERVRSRVRALASEADALITTGGTGIGPRDSTYEAIDGLLTKKLDGFGELFRQLSYAKIGAAAMLSRAVAGVVGSAVVFTLPGSVDAVALALDTLVLPDLGHAVKVAKRAGQAGLRADQASWAPKSPKAALARFAEDVRTIAAVAPMLEVEPAVCAVYESFAAGATLRTERMRYSELLILVGQLTARSG